MWREITTLNSNTSLIYYKYFDKLYPNFIIIKGQEVSVEHTV